MDNQASDGAWEKAMRGEIPWDADACAQAMEWYHRLVHTPKDDWDLSSEKTLRLQKSPSAEPVTYSFNMFAAPVQFAKYMGDRYKGIEASSHAMRLMKIQMFLEDNKQALILDGLVREETGEPEMRNELLRALCEGKYTGIKRGADGSIGHEYEYAVVVAQAKALLSE